MPRAKALLTFGRVSTVTQLLREGATPFREKKGEGIAKRHILTPLSMYNQLRYSFQGTSIIYYALVYSLEKSETS